MTRIRTTETASSMEALRSADLLRRARTGELVAAIAASRRLDRLAWRRRRPQLASAALAASYRTSI